MYLNKFGRHTFIMINKKYFISLSGKWYSNGILNDRKFLNPNPTMHGYNYISSTKKFAKTIIKIYQNVHSNLHS